MQHCHQLPLTIDLVLAPQGKSLNADGVGYVAEDRLDDPQSHPVNVAAKG